MKLVFLTNYIHHHQTPLADEFYKILGDDYKYIAMAALPKWLQEGGYNPAIKRNYIVRAYENSESIEYTRQLINSADVVIIGSAPEILIQERLSQNKVTFHYSERWIKNWKFYHPLSLYQRYKFHFRYRNYKSYMLCASAYTAIDVNKVFCYPNKCFKWGYFTKVVDDYETKLLKHDVSTSESTSLMWCARFLRWKHPELPVQMAAKLKSKGYNFILNMYGSGEELEKTIQLAKNLQVDDIVKFKGNLPNEEILEEMRKHKIFLFTSDRNEGWGAVLNESMANGCAVVASDKIGSVPFLVKNQVNGCIFKSENLISLTEKVEYLLNNPTVCEEISREAVKTIKNIWSPRNAAKNFVLLANGILKGEEVYIIDGPCSKA